MHSKVTGKLERRWEAWTRGWNPPVPPAARASPVRTGGRLSVVLMSGSLLTFPPESEDSEALESSLATGRAVQKRKEARAPLSSVSHSSALTHILFSPNES